MRTRSRDYRGEEDYRAIHRLLVECYARNRSLHCWDPSRLDWWRYNIRADDERSGRRTWEREIRLWETAEGRLVGVAHPEGTVRAKIDWGDVYLQVHPDHRRLEEEMFTWAGERHAARRPEGGERWPLKTSVFNYDEDRAALLERLGFRDQGVTGYTRRRTLGEPLPEEDAPAGYRIREVGPDEMEPWAEVVAAAFENPLNTPERARVWLLAPTPRTDLVAVAPDGTFAAFCMVWFEEHNGVGVFEPVGTHPAHQRRGLGKAIMTEGLRRLKALGATMAYLGVGTDEGANRLYEAVGFRERDAEHCWQKDY
jgi:ribosomal protein S18 acetylase RimI-like enzyme